MYRNISKQVHLRDVQPNDLPWLYEMNIDPESNALAGTIARSADAFHANWATIFAIENRVAKAIMLGDLPVGYIVCFQRDARWLLGYWISKDYWGQRIASRALEIFFEECRIRPLYAQAATANLASMRLLQKFGFVIQKIEMCAAEERYLACEVADFILQ